MNKWMKKKREFDLHLEKKSFEKKVEKKEKQE